MRAIGIQCSNASRFHTNRALRGVCLALVLSATAIRAVPPPAGVAPVGTPAGGFAIDGDLIANQPAGGIGDWLKLSSVPGTGEGVVALNGIPLNPNMTFHYLDPAGVNDADNIFQGGKWFMIPKIGPGPWENPPTRPTSHVLFHVTTDAEATSGWLFGGPLSNNGLYIDFEFLQNTLLKNSNFTFFAGPDGGQPPMTCSEPGFLAADRGRFLCLALDAERSGRL
jgi:hypothetical protein